MHRLKVHVMNVTDKYGEIISLNFEKKKNYKSGHYYLQAQILLKSFWYPIKLLFNKPLQRKI